MNKPVANFSEFEKKYGGTSHALHGLGKPSIYGASGRRHVTIKRRKVKIQEVGKFSDLPMVRKYRGGLPRGFNERGWYGNTFGHREAALYGKYGAAKVHQVKPRAHRGFAIHQTEHGYILIPKAPRVDENFNVANPPAKVQEPEVVVPPVTTEFGLNKKKFDIAEAGGRFAKDASNIKKSYEEIRQEAIARRAVPLPTYEDVGAEKLGRDIRTGSFYATKTGQTISAGLKFLAERKRKAELKKKEEAYNAAQARAEEARNARIEFQTELEKKRLAELKKRNGVQEESKESGIQELAKEAKVQETPEEIAADYARV